MPIAFPPRSQATLRNNVAAIRSLNESVRVNPNLGRPGALFTDSLLNPGIGRPLNVQPNLYNLGSMYSDAARNAVINPVGTIRVSSSARARMGGILNMSLSGISRDTNSAALGNCRVMIFRTGDNSFVGEVTSDANGLWTIPMLKGGPFFQNNYKVGSPDVCGTSVNTLVPVQV